MRWTFQKKDQLRKQLFEISWPLLRSHRVKIDIRDECAEGDGATQKDSF